MLKFGIILAKREVKMQKYFKLLSSFLLFAVCALFFTENLNAKSKTIQENILYKDPNCECCNKWADYMDKNGFPLTIKKVNHHQMISIKEKYHIPFEFQSCHTAIINNYVFEGHIPVEDIKKFLKKPPRDSLGLAVPGMPIGSPGMEQSTFIEPYNVYLIKKNGDTAVWNQH